MAPTPQNKLWWSETYYPVWLRGHKEYERSKTMEPILTYDRLAGHPQNYTINQNDKCSKDSVNMAKACDQCIFPRWLIKAWFISVVKWTTRQLRWTLAGTATINAIRVRQSYIRDQCWRLWIKEAAPINCYFNSPESTGPNGLSRLPRPTVEANDILHLYRLYSMRLWN